MLCHLLWACCSRIFLVASLSIGIISTVAHIAYAETVVTAAITPEGSTTEASIAEEQFTARALFQPLEKAKISSEIGAKIMTLPFRSGESFKKGDLLIRFDCRLVEARVAVARAQLKADRKTLENKQYLKTLNSVGELDIHLASAAYEKSKGELDAVLYQKEQCHIKAPFSGRLVQALVNAHETVSPGDPLLEILNDTQLEIVLVVPSQWLSWLQLRQAFKVKVDETGKQYTGHVVNFGAAIDPVSQTITLYGHLDNSTMTSATTTEILSGMSGTAVFEKTASNNKPKNRS